MEINFTKKCFRCAEEGKCFCSNSKNVGIFKYVRQDENGSNLQHYDVQPLHQAPTKSEPIQQEKPDSGYSLFSAVSLAMANRPVCFDSCGTDTECTQQNEPFTFRKQTESPSTLQSLLESSWMSASLHCSILDLYEGNDVIGFGKPPTSDFSMSAFLLHSPRKRSSIGSSKLNFHPETRLVDAKDKLELQLSNSQTKVMPSGVPSQSNLKSQENCVNHWSSLAKSSFKPDSTMLARRGVEPQHLALDGDSTQTRIPSNMSSLVTLENNKRFTWTDQHFVGDQTWDKKTRSQKSMMQSEANADKLMMQSCLDLHIPFPDRGQSSRLKRNCTFWTRSSGASYPQGGTSKQEQLSNVNQLPVARLVFNTNTEGKTGERFQALYRFRLLLRCFRIWRDGLRFLNRARIFRQRRILSQCLFTLQHAVLLRRAQTDTAERRRSTLTLAQCFYTWKGLYTRRCLARLGSESFSQWRIIALRRRLVAPSDAAVVTNVCSARRNRQTHSAAVIHHHLSVLCAHWSWWRQAWLKRVRRSQQEQQAEVWRENKFRSAAWSRWLCVWQSRWLKRDLCRRVLHHWHKYALRVRLMRLSQVARQFLSIRMLSAAFQRWREAKEKKQKMKMVRHLWERRKLQVAFRIWTRSLQARMSVSRFEDARRRSCLVRSLCAWQMLLTRRTVLEELCRRRKTVTAKSFLRQWRRALELRLLEKHVLVELYLRRQQTSQRCSAVQPSGQCALSSGEDVRNRILLQNLFSTWRENVKKQQRARFHHAECVREGIRRVLLQWHGLTQTELCGRVQSFRAKLAQLQANTNPSVWQDETERYAKLGPGLVNTAQREQHCPLQATSLQDNQCDEEESRDLCISSSSHSGQCYSRQFALVRKALVRMIHPDLSLAFSQWKAVLHTSREKTRQAHEFSSRRGRTGLRLAFINWRIRAEMQNRADRCRERTLLSHSLTVWKRLLWGRRRALQLQQQAEHFHHGKLVQHCFPTWHRQVFWPGWEDLHLLNRHVKERRELQRLRWAFSTWAARGRQQKAAGVFRAHLLLKRVFKAWQKRIWCHKENQVVALAHTQRTHCRAAFSQWRTSRAQQQLANDRAKHTVHLRSKHILQCWREYTHNRCCMYIRLGSLIKERESILKRKSLFIWQQALEHLKRAQQFNQKVLMFRCYSNWLCVTKRSKKLASNSQQLRDLQAQKLQNSTFEFWKAKLLCRLALKRRIRILAVRWRRAAQMHQAERQQIRHMLAFFIQLWKEKLDLQRARRTRATAALQIWRRHVSRAKQEREGLQRISKWRQTHMFLFWIRLTRLSITSKERHKQTQKKQMLLAWRCYTVSAQTMRYSEAVFQYGSELRVTASCLSLWRRALIQAQTQQSVLEARLKLRQFKQTTQIFQSWRAAAALRRAVKKSNATLLKKSFVFWMQRRVIIKTAIEFQAQRQTQVAQLALTSWSLWAKDHKRLRHMEEAVRLWLEGRQVTVVFQQWKKVYRQHRVAKSYCQIHHLSRAFWTWRISVHQECRNIEMCLVYLQTRTAFQTWRRAAASHKAVRFLTERVSETERKRLLRAVLRTWHHKMQTLKLCEETSDRLLQALWRAKYLRRWHNRTLKRRERMELMRLYWASWKSQTAASLLYIQQHEHDTLQRAWLTWRKRRIRSRVATNFAARFSRAVLEKAFRLWQQQVLASRLPPRHVSLMLSVAELSSSATGVNGVEHSGQQLT